jgi:uncharacterized protein (TIGR03435 family)
MEARKECHTMTDHLSYAAILHQKKLLIAAVCIALAIPGFILIASQATSTKPLAYDVISVKRSKPDEGMQVTTRPDGFSARNVTLWELIYNAYDVRAADPVKGLPGWAASTRFDVEAKMDDSTFAALQKLPQQQTSQSQRSMLQSLLADRFQLRAHHETAERPIYDLVIANTGFKLKESQSSKSEGWMGSGQIHYLSSPISSLAFTLSNASEVGRLVVDKTGLTGHYDIAIKWTSDKGLSADDAGPSIFTALEEQLGLKLVPAKGPVDTIVVDHVEQPSPN